MSHLYEIAYKAVSAMPQFLIRARMCWCNRPAGQFHDCNPQLIPAWRTSTAKKAQRHLARAWRDKRNFIHRFKYNVILACKTVQGITPKGWRKLSHVIKYQRHPAMKSAYGSEHLCKRQHEMKHLRCLHTVLQTFTLSAKHEMLCLLWLVIANLCRELWPGKNTKKFWSKRHIKTFINLMSYYLNRIDDFLNILLGIPSRFLITNA